MQAKKKKEMRQYAFTKRFDADTVPDLQSPQRTRSMAHFTLLPLTRITGSWCPSSRWVPWPSFQLELATDLCSPGKRGSPQHQVAYIATSDSRGGSHPFAQVLKCTGKQAVSELSIF
ncbi:uncharacterized protein LOC144071474 [Stigmatopora argus]